MASDLIQEKRKKKDQKESHKHMHKQDAFSKVRSVSVRLPSSIGVQRDQLKDEKRFSFGSAYLPDPEGRHTTDVQMYKFFHHLEPK